MQVFQINDNLIVEFHPYCYKIVFIENDVVTTFMFMDLLGSNLNGNFIIDICDYKVNMLNCSSDINEIVFILKNL